MFAGSTCVEVAVAVAESCEEEEVGVGAVIVTVGTGLVSPAVSSGFVSTTVVPPLPSPVAGSISTVTPVACGSVTGADPPVTPVASVFPAVPVPESPPVCGSPPCPLTYEADGLVFESVGDWPSGEAVVAVEPSPFAQDSLTVVPPRGEFATVAALPDARAVGAEPEPDPDPPAEPAPAAAAAPFSCTTAPLSPGFPTRTSTFTFFGLSWLEFAEAFAFPA